MEKRYQLLTFIREGRLVIQLREQITYLETEVQRLRGMAYEEKQRADRAVDRLLGSLQVSPITVSKPETGDVMKAIDDELFGEISTEEWAKDHGLTKQEAADQKELY